MKGIMLGLLLLVCTGCAALNTALYVADIFTEPTPIIPTCEKETVGVSWKGDICLKHTDGTYRWVKQ